MFFKSTTIRGQLSFQILYLLLISGIVVVCTLLAYSPKDMVQLLPRVGTVIHVYADSVEANGTSKAKWIDRESVHFQCELQYGIEYPYCGVAIKFKQRESKNYDWLDYFEFSELDRFDFASFDWLEIDLEYVGDGNSLNVFMRSAKNMPSNFEEYSQKKYYVTSHVGFDEKAFIPLKQFNLASWWVEKYSSNTGEREVDFSSIFEIGIELPFKSKPGVYDIKINNISIYKPFIDRGLLILTLVIFLFILVTTFLSRTFLTKTKSFEEENRSLRSTVGKDPLTNCYNRRGFEVATENMFPITEADSVFVVVIDLDHFKTINDHFGHHVGDEVLKQVAIVLTSMLRESDILVRWGGEEFVLVSNISTQGIKNVAERMLKTLGDIRLNEIPSSFKISASIGVTQVKKNETFINAFRRADSAMYEVKVSGRNGWLLV